MHSQAIILNLSSVYEIGKRGSQVHVLYYGGFDASGHYMVTDLNNRIARTGIDLELNYSDFERVTVTPEQIERYDLPYMPDGEILFFDVGAHQKLLNKYGKHTKSAKY